jgi:diguanylate cyclase (GGDEF)-like protein/PAS domain S-box-containing protein
MNVKKPLKTREELLTENEELRARLREAEEVVRAVRCGEVDAFFVTDTQGERVFAREGAESAYRVLVESMNEGAAILKDGGVLLYCNGRLAAMLKSSLEKVMGASLFRFVSPADKKTFAMLLEQRQAEPCTREITLCSEDGTALPVKLSMSPMEVHGEPGICVVATDLTEHNRAKEELRSLSLVDELTGLHNRRGFLTLAQQQLKLARRLPGQLFLVFADLDGLKPINDTLGHLSGDHALTDAADILRKTFRESDIVARLGGDEFAVLATGTPDMNSETLAKRLQGQLDVHNAGGRRPFRLSMSVGIVHYDSENPMPIIDLLRQADAAMYEQKRRKRESAIGNEPARQQMYAC